MASNYLHASPWLTIIVLGLSILGLTKGQLNRSDFLLETQEVVAKRGEKLIINCTIPAGFQPTNVTWKKNGTLLQYSSRIYTLSNGSLNFKRVRNKKKKGSSDEGYYSCFVKNSKGVVLASQTHLRIANMARQFSVQPQSLTAPLSATVYFKCAIGAVPLPVYEWDFNGSPLTVNDEKYKVHTSGLLEITNIGAADQGSYRCVATSLEEQKVSREVDLTIGDQTSLPPQVVSAPRNQTVISGESAIMECLAFGHPRPRITWHKAGGLPVDSTVIGGTSLHIRNVQIEDGGKYVCQVEADGMIQPLVTAAWLTVIDSPYLIKVPTPVEIKNNNKLKLSCAVGGGHPQPTVTWLKDGHKLTFDGADKKWQDDTLSIAYIFFEDSGYYQCLAENQAGIVTAFSHVNVVIDRNAPLPPTNLRAKTISSSEIELSWADAMTRNKLVVVAYSYHYIPTAGGIELQQAGNQLTARIANLIPYTNYTLYVIAYSLGGASDRSERITAMTDSDVPLSAPEFDVSSEGSESFKVSWKVLPVDKARGEIMYYMIYYRKHPVGTRPGAAQMTEVSGHVHQYNVTGLLPNTHYDVYVLAATDKGAPYLPESEQPWKTVVTLKNSPEVPHTPGLQLVALNSTAILVNWYLLPSSRIQGYKLYLKQPNQPRGSIIRLNATAQTYTFTQLVANQWYEICLWAYTEEHEGQTAIKSIKTLPTGSEHTVDRLVPPPMNVDALAQSNTTVMVYWSTFPGHSMFISHYTLRYKPVGRRQNATTFSKFLFMENILSNKTIVSGLLPYTLYNFAVRCHSGVVKGPFGDGVQVRTNEGLPGAPGLVLLAAIDERSIVLQWLAPVEPNGIITMYIIHYSANKHAPASSWNKQFLKGNTSKTVISNLEPGTTYWIRLQTSSGAGVGPSSLPVKVTVFGKRNKGKSPLATNDDVAPAGLSDQVMGVIIGVAIGLGCIVICVFIIICMRRMNYCTLQSHHMNHGHSNGHGHAPYENGRLAHIGNRLSHAGSVELDSVMPILTTFKENEMMYEKELNGHIHNGKTNGKSNGTKYTNGHANGHTNGRAGNGYSTSHCDTAPHQSNGSSFAYMGLPHADTPHETSLDDIDRSYEEPDSEPEINEHRECLPPSASPMCEHQSAGLGVNQHSAEDEDAIDPPQDNRNLGGERDPKPPQRLTTFKPENLHNDTSNSRQPLVICSSSNTQAHMPRQRSTSRSGDVCSA